MKHHEGGGRNLWMVGAVGFVILLLGVKWYMQELERPSDRRICASHMRRGGLIMLVYSEDHGGKLPDGDVWRKIRPYAAQFGVTDKDACPRARRRFEASYSANPFLTGTNLRQLSNDADWVLVYEGTGGTVSPRHSGGANYYFADGRIQYTRHSISLRPFVLPLNKRENDYPSPCLY